MPEEIQWKSILKSMYVTHYLADSSSALVVQFLQISSLKYKSRRHLDIFIFISVLQE